MSVRTEPIRASAQVAGVITNYGEGVLWQRQAHYITDGMPTRERVSRIRSKIQDWKLKKLRNDNKLPRSMFNVVSTVEVGDK